MASKVILNTLDKLPEEMLEENGNVTLAVDTMYIIKIPFIITTSRAIHFAIIEMIKKQEKGDYYEVYTTSN